MKFEQKLIEGTFIKRYQRFLADIELNNGQIITAHCPNSGAMLGLKTPGMRVWVSEVPVNSERKLRYTWEIAESDGVLVGANTMRPNELVAEALEQKRIEPLQIYSQWRREVKYSKNSRIDFLLGEEGLPPCYLEIKNVHLKREGTAQFPDAVTERGSKHMDALSEMLDHGMRAVVLYVVQREDCDRFRLADDIDPLYAKKSKEAKSKGLETFCYRCKVSLDDIVIDQQIPVDL